MPYSTRSTICLASESRASPRIGWVSETVMVRSMLAASATSNRSRSASGLSSAARAALSRSLSACRRALTPRGTYVVVGVRDMGRWFGLGRQTKALLLSPFVRQRMRVFVVRHNREDLAVLKELVEAGKVAPVIDRRYTLREVPEALRYQGEGHSQGKIVIAV